MSEIPVVLRPQGFNETAQQATIASKALDEVGKKITSLEKLGEVAKKLGPVTAAITLGTLAARNFVDGLSTVADEAERTATATTAAFRQVAKVIDDATKAADAQGRAAVSSLGPALQRAAAAGVSTDQAASVAKRYGLDLAGGADAATLAKNIGGNSAQNLEAARSIQAGSGGTLQEALAKLAEAVKGGLVVGGSANETAAAVLRAGGVATDATQLGIARNAFDRSPVSRTLAEQGAAAVDLQLASLGRGLSTGGSSGRAATADAVQELNTPGSRILSDNQAALDGSAADRLAGNIARRKTTYGALEDVGSRAFGGGGSQSSKGATEAAQLADALRQAIDASILGQRLGKDAVPQ